ncbi:15008_t:CDS:2, partial [Racocetra fulgida]
MNNVVYDREALLRIVSTFPLIDNHCHNLLTSDASLICPLEVCFSEAHGDALKNMPQTSTLKRGVRQLAELYNCPPTLDNIKQVKALMSYIDIYKTCFKPTGIQALLLDDGLDALGDLMGVQSHVELVDVARRIVRIESIAEKTLYDLAMSATCKDQKVLNFEAFEESLKKQFETYAKSESVAAFKSIAAYRSGLNINCDSNPEAITVALKNIITDFKSLSDKKGSVKLVNKVLTDHILKPLIEKHPNAKFVLLHAAYPYTRQAGYLSSIYSNVYVDTDGHCHPESFYVAAIQGRAALSK